MKITRYAQSCLLVETGGMDGAKRLLIDPGFIGYDEKLLEEWGDVDIILITHKHADHCHAPAILWMTQNKKTKVYTTKEVADSYKELSPRIIKEGDIIKEAAISIEVVKAVHGYIPLLKGDKEVKENVGYIISDSRNRAYVTGDTICFRNDYRCDAIFVPISAHGLVMSPFEAALFSKETGAKVVVPIHLDNPKFIPDVEAFRKECKNNCLDCRVLGIKESIVL